MNGCGGCDDDYDYYEAEEDAVVGAGFLPRVLIFGLGRLGPGTRHPWVRAVLHAHLFTFTSVAVVALVFGFVVLARVFGFVFVPTQIISMYTFPVRSCFRCNLR